MIIGNQFFNREHNIQDYVNNLKLIMERKFNIRYLLIMNNK